MFCAVGQGYIMHTNHHRGTNFKHARLSLSHTLATEAGMGVLVALSSTCLCRRC